MIFPDMKYFYFISQETKYQWQKIPIETDDSEESVLQLEIHNYWPKIAQINSNEYLLIGGGFHIGSNECFRLNIRTR